MKKLLIVEDDRWILAWLKLYMEGQDFTLDTMSTWEGAAEKILSGDYDLITLDINLPVKDGIEICKEVRQKSNVPIVMLTAKNDEFDRILGLEIWADDYITKPFSPRELVARIRSILRRSESTNSSTQQNSSIKYWEYEILLNEHCVSKNWEKISLTKSEFDIFKYLVDNKWKIISRDTLMKEIIGYEQYMFDRTIDTHIKNLRRKLWDKWTIETIRWEGYKVN